MLVFRDGGLPPSLRGLIWRGSAVATVEARTKKLRAKNFDGIVGHQIAQISYWRLMINAALMLLDMTMFILASAVVLTWKNELVFHSARFGFSMPFAVYCLLAACIWVLCLRSMGVYHRHVMGDGYQLNVLMFKAIVECLIALCAFCLLYTSPSPRDRG